MFSVLAFSTHQCSAKQLSAIVLSKCKNMQNRNIVDRHLRYSIDSTVSLKSCVLTIKSVPVNAAICNDLGLLITDMTAPLANLLVMVQMGQQNIQDCLGSGLALPAADFISSTDSQFALPTVDLAVHSLVHPTTRTDSQASANGSTDSWISMITGLGVGIGVGTGGTLLLAALLLLLFQH